MTKQSAKYYFNFDDCLVINERMAMVHNEVTKVNVLRTCLKSNIFGMIVQKR